MTKLLMNPLNKLRDAREIARKSFWKIIGVFVVSILINSLLLSKLAETNQVVQLKSSNFYQKI
ncbi:hypothetical protein ES703_44820 [subsurface metagenome]